MVQGLSEFNRKWGGVAANIRAAIQSELEKVAARVVADMNAVKPLPEIEIGWTWGNPPRGSVSLGRVQSGGSNEMRITIYAVGAQGSGFAAAWFEFGTADRFHKSGKYVGKITAQPFFYPIWRARKRSVKSAVTRAISKAVKQS